LPGWPPGFRGPTDLCAGARPTAIELGEAGLLLEEARALANNQPLSPRAPRRAACCRFHPALVLAPASGVLGLAETARSRPRRAATRLRRHGLRPYRKPSRIFCPAGIEMPTFFPALLPIRNRVVFRSMPMNILAELGQPEQQRQVACSG
jgi:hypothetical protein